MHHQFEGECAGLTRDKLAHGLKTCSIALSVMSALFACLCCRPPCRYWCPAGDGCADQPIEAGRAAIGKNGVISDPVVHARAMTLPHGSPRHFPTGRVRIVPSPIVGRKVIRNFCSVLVRRTINRRLTFIPCQPTTPHAASPFILARWAKAACAVAVFSALPPKLEGCGLQRAHRKTEFPANHRFYSWHQDGRCVMVDWPPDKKHMPGTASGTHL